MSMAAVVNFAPEAGSVELRDIPRPEAPGEDQVLLDVAAVSVCGSDLHQWTASHSWEVAYPVVLGHEFGGTVVAVGARVGDFAVGDRVVSETAAVIDPASPMSRTGRYNLDPSRRGFGYGVDGAMAERVAVPARCLHRVPDGLAFERAALTEPCCVAYNAVVCNGEIRPGDRVLVYGPGPIGILCAIMARLQGASVGIVGLERDAERLRVAEGYGCTALIGDAREWALAGDGLGVAGAIDAAGVSATLRSALDLVRPGGWISKVGWGPQPLYFSLDPLVQKNLTLRGSFSHTWAMWEAVLAMLADGRLEVDLVIGGRWDLADWHQAFEAQHAGEVVKAVLVPGG